MVVIDIKSFAKTLLRKKFFISHCRAKFFSAEIFFFYQSFCQISLSYIIIHCILRYYSKNDMKTPSYIYWTLILIWIGKANSNGKE